MLIIKDVEEIESRNDTLVLKTKSGIDICFKRDAGPNYIDIESYISEDGIDLHITAAVHWDDSNRTK